MDLCDIVLLNEMHGQSRLVHRRSWLNALNEVVLTSTNSPCVYQEKEKKIQFPSNNCYLYSCSASQRHFHLTS